MSKKYIAYGSNLSVEQMAHRCPDATVVGTIDAYAGAVPVVPTIDSWTVGNTVYAPTGEFALYNAAGECVYTGIPQGMTDEMIEAGPYTAYPVIKTTVAAFGIYNGKFISVKNHNLIAKAFDFFYAC